MSRFTRIAKTDECPPGASLEVVAQGRVIALFNVEGSYYALDGVCPHQGGPLGQGQLCGPVVTCPWHGWQFDVRNGQNQITPAITQPTLPVRVEDGEVLVGLDEASNSS